MSTSFIEILDLGLQPLSNNYLTNKTTNEFKYHLIAGINPETFLFTQKYEIDSSKMFNDNYSYRASMSATMRQHFSDIAIKIKDYTLNNVLEIGSNDGVFLKNWNTNSIVAVEPCKNFSDFTNSIGYKTYNEFWNTRTAEMLLEHHKKFEVIYSANCFCHIYNLNDAFNAIKSCLSPNGVFIFEDPSLLQMLYNNSYDQIYDEHPHIFSIFALQNIFKKLDLEIINVEPISVHGGSNRIYVSHKGCKPIQQTVFNTILLEKLYGLNTIDAYRLFSDRVAASKTQLTTLLSNCKDSGLKIISYGATSKSATIYNYCNIDNSIINYIIDTTPEKINKFSPGVHIPIKYYNEIDSSVNIAFLGAWNFISEIMQKEKNYINNNGRFITHVPNIKIL